MSWVIVEQLQARPASDGDGVKLLRVFGGPKPERFDPFLMLDEFGSDEASDYIGGFPSHPHRGFETISYMLEGKLEHRDHMGNVGLLNDGDVQWMTAGRGVIHSEMPRQSEGKMRGFQFWLNLPAAKKMKPAYYKDVPAEDIPVFQIGKVGVKAIAGETTINSEPVKGYFDVPDTQALVLDISLPGHGEAAITIADNFTTLLYVYDGLLFLTHADTPTRSKTLTRFAGEGELLIKNKDENTARAILLAGKPIKEPIVQYGPFVMNTLAEIEQAIMDYQTGKLTAT